MIRIATIIFLSFLISCSSHVMHIASVSPDYYRIDKKQEANDKEIEELINPYKSWLDKSMNRVLGKVEKSMKKSKPNSPLNNWVADVIYEEANNEAGGVDFAVQNYGGIRVPGITEGEITVGKVYELMPFDNMVTVLTANGDIVKMLFDRIADYGGWPISKNTRFTIHNGKATDIIINGKPFDINSNYTFALPDYIANGGDSCFFLSKAERKDLKLLIRDAMIHHIETNNNIIKYNDEKRISIQ